jgi:hypothetical protein
MIPVVRAGRGPLAVGGRDRARPLTGGPHGVTSLAFATIQCDSRHAGDKTPEGQVATSSFTDSTMSARPCLASAKNMPVFGSVYSSLSMPA